MSTAEQQFAAAAEAAIQTCIQEHNYNPTRIRGMIQRRQAEGGSAADAAVDLINSGNVQEGFTKIWEICQKPGNAEAYKLTLEWLVCQEQYAELFDEDTIALARQRLRDYFGVEPAG